MRVLGIESSCDETGLAIYDSKAGLIADILHSQTQLHVEYGGVVPELASRDHVRFLTPLLQQLLKQAGCQLKEIDAIAYTNGPGLAGALMVGSIFSRSLGMACNVPTLGIHHMEAHLLAPMLEDRSPEFPFLALLVSGGHTQIVSVTNVGQYELLGQSVDDAAGEAFDKTAKMLNLPYPGGPNIASLAEQGRDRFKFPRPMCDRAGLDLSFSGLKTYTLTTIEKQKINNDFTEQTQADIAFAFEQAVIDCLLIKCKRALQQSGYQRLVVAGGVSANKKLRTKLQQMATQQNIEIFYPRPKFCTDNGAMVAYTGWLRLSQGQKDGLATEPKPRWPITSITPAQEG